MLRVTQLTNYGIAILEKLAWNTSHTHFSSRDLAQQLGLPLSVTAKILKSLTRGGLLISHRGINGGYQLAKPAVSISMAEIVTALEGPVKLASSERMSDGFHPCDFINRTIHQTLAGISLSDMAKEHSNSITGNTPEAPPISQPTQTPDGEDISQWQPHWSFAKIILTNTWVRFESTHFSLRKKNIPWL